MRKRHSKVTYNPAELVVSRQQMLQDGGSKIVRDALWIVEQGAARWETIQYPDGKERIALVFRVDMWELVDGRLQLKQGGE